MSPVVSSASLTYSFYLQSNFLFHLCFQQVLFVFIFLFSTPGITGGISCGGALLYSIGCYQVGQLLYFTEGYMGELPASRLEAWALQFLKIFKAKGTNPLSNRRI